MKGYVVKLFTIITFIFAYLIGVDINKNSKNSLSLAYSNKVGEILNANLSQNDVALFAALSASVETKNSLGSSTLYRDKISSVTIKVANADYDASVYTLKITGPNGENDTNNWSVTDKYKTGNTLYIKLKRSGDAPTVGSYKATITNSRITSSKVSVSFTVYGYYNYFEITETELISSTHGYSNEANKWEIDITGLADQIYEKVSSDDVDDFNVTIKYGNSNVTTSKFNVTKSKDKIYISNKTGFFTSPQSGTYEVTITHTDNDFNPTTLAKKTSFKIGTKNIKLTEKSSESHRYVRQMMDVNYTLKIETLCCSPPDNFNILRLA